MTDASVAASAGEIKVVRDLAKQYVELCQKPDQSRRRRLWRELNSLRSRQPAIYVRACAWSEMPQSQCLCQDPLLRGHENFFRHAIFQDTFDDDYIFELWVTVPAVHVLPPQGLWGVPITWHGRGGGNAGKCESPIQDPDDLRKLIVPRHAIDEVATRRKFARVQETMGDIITVALDRGPAWRTWNADLSSDLAQLRGLEQVMWDMIDRPQWLHQLLAFMRDGVLKAQSEAEQAGDFRLCNHQNQAMPYALELNDPSAHPQPVARKELWCFCASQELTLVGPAMWDEFMLRYQLPIMKEYGLVAYGCCENLTQKIPLLRQIPNLRRIAVSPFGDVKKCAEQIGRQYVISYRPSPADMVSYGFDENRIREMLHRDMDCLRGCCFDITLKDVQTVQQDPTRIRRWVQVTRQVIADMNIA